MDAAERAAEELRRVAEQRAAERIAEAERAADMRVQAADDEADEVRAEAVVEAERLRQDAEQTAREAHDRAVAQARRLLAEARAAARDVLREGETLSGHLHELSDALRINAERLLRDVRAAHVALTSRLDGVDPDRSPAPARSDAGRRAPAATSDEPEIPEFIPRARR